MSETPSDPLPQTGGAWVRDPDGSLRREGASEPEKATRRGRGPGRQGGVEAPVKEA